LFDFYINLIKVKAINRLQIVAGWKCPEQMAK